MHNRFANEFSEFTFLKINNNIIERKNSFFSIKVMTVNLINNNKKIVIKCSNKVLFEDLKSFMLEINNNYVVNQTLVKDLKKINWPLPQKLNKQSFEYIYAPELPPNIIYYKTISK